MAMQALSDAASVIGAAIDMTGFDLSRGSEKGINVREDEVIAGAALVDDIGWICGVPDDIIVQHALHCVGEVAHVGLVGANEAEFILDLHQGHILM